MLEFLQQLFQRRGARPAGWQPAAAPSPAQLRRYRAWVAQGVYRNWLGPYFKAYHLLKAGISSQRGLRVELLREAGRQGALFFYDHAMGPGNFELLSQLLAERVTQQGYHRACHDHRRRQQQRLHELTVKQLFKPNPTDCVDCGRCNQRFGLVHLDVVYLNGEPLFIQLSTNPVHQTEAHFTPAQSFEALLEALFNEPAATAAETQRVAEYAG